MNVMHVPALERNGNHRPVEPGRTNVPPVAEPLETWFATLVDLVLGATRSVEASVFECRRAPGRALSAGRGVARPNEKPSPPLIARLAADSGSARGPSGAFAVKARDAGADALQLVGLRFSDGEEPVALGYALFHGAPTNEEWRALQVICRLGGGLIVTHKKSLTQLQTSAGTHAFQIRMLEALRLGLDAYWEADEAGNVANVVLLSASPDNVLLRALEGRNLRAMLPAGGGEFRNLRCDVGGGDHTGTLVLSGRVASDGSVTGAARLAAAGPGAGMTNQVARSLIEKLETAREHEAAQVRETELVLDGLRILTSSKSSREVFAALLELLAPALEFEAAIILQRDWSGHIAASAATDPAVAALDWHGAGTSLFAGADIAQLYRMPQELALPAAEGGAPLPYASALAIGLRGGSKSTILLCLHRGANFFTTRHQGLGTRLSLIASQAFMNEEERQKVVDASKLATIGELAAGIVHEINQPLTVMTLGINNMLEMLELGAAEPGKLKAKLERLQGQIERVTKIVANMRVLSRRSDGVAEPFSVDEAIREAAGIVQHKLATAEIALELPAEAGFFAHGNRLEFSQVILNLLTNAHDAIQSKVKQAGDASGPMAIHVAAGTPDAEWLEISVRDTGCGFPTKDAERAFEPFFTTKEVGKGTGLGLALCRRIVENMGGNIGLGNWERGAEIRVRLKRAP